jgi:hypothetical protein
MCTVAPLNVAPDALVHDDEHAALVQEGYGPHWRATGGGPVSGIHINMH